jgi:putative membrane protein
MRLWRNGVQAMALVMAAGLVVGCAKDEDDTDAGTTTDSLAAAPAPAPAPTLTDANIAAIVVAANSADSAAGELAQTKGTDAEVKAFGKRMVADHGAVNKKATAWATASGTTPADNDDSNKMKSDAQAHMADLGTKTGADFDKAYIDHEVDMHQQVLDAIDQKLMPGAQNADLKALLTETRPAVAAHLESAKAIQAKLNK